MAKFSWRRVALALAAVWLVTMLFGRIADRLILWPSTSPIDAGGAQRRVVGGIEVWVMPARTRMKRAVLRFYGNAARAEDGVLMDARDWPDDVECWSVNYPGYGGSAGKASLQGIADAAIAVYDEIAKRGVPIYVVGTSLGTTAALHVSAERPVAGVVLHNPPALRELVVGEFGWWNAWLLAWPVSLQIPRALDSIANAKRSHAPALFVLAEADEVVPHRYHLKVADAYAGEKEILLVPGATHNDPPPVAYKAALSRLFARERL